MSNLEFKVINAVLQNKDLNVLLAPNTNELFDSCADIWQTIKNYHAKYRAVPSLEIIQERFPDLPTLVVTGEPEHYLDELRDHFIRAKLSNIMVRQNRALQTDAGKHVLMKIQGELSELARYTNASRELNLMDFDDAERHYAEVHKKALEMGGVPGISTGLDFVDSAYPTGFVGGDLVTIFGWSNHGKSNLTTLMACNAFIKGFKPMIVSLEMGPEQVRDRVYTILGSGIFQNSQLSLGNVNIDDFRSWSTKHSDKSDFIVLSGNGVNEVTPNFVHAKIEEHRPSFCVVDYLQLGSDNAMSSDMIHKMRNMSQEYKQVAVANDIPVVVISSATPENGSATQDPPRLEQTAWGRSLGYDSDLMMAIQKKSDTMFEVVGRKNRRGPLFGGFVEWDIDSGVWKERYDLS